MFSLPSRMQTEFTWESLKAHTDALPEKRYFLVTGKGSYHSCGAEKKVNDTLGSNRTYRFVDYHENPTIDDIFRGLKAYQTGHYGGIVAVGGGSAIDTAKAIHLLSEINLTDLPSYVTGEKEVKKHLSRREFIAIPTTFGTGSESTHFAVIYIEEKKYSLASELAMPTGYILDASLGMNAPPLVKATTGMDALCQATESFWAVNATEESRQYASKAIPLIIGNLCDFVKSPSSQNTKAMMQAANLAGRAINISKTTAPHALSYAITKAYDIPHGHAVALTLPYFFELHENSPTTAKSLNKLLSLLGVNTAKEAKSLFHGLMNDIGLGLTIPKTGVSVVNKHETVSELASRVNTERLGNHPLGLKHDDIKKIISHIFPI